MTYIHKSTIPPTSTPADRMRELEILCKEMAEALSDTMDEIKYHGLERHDDHPRGCGWVRVCTPARAVLEKYNRMMR
jgi:hypothetical protein